MSCDRLTGRHPRFDTRPDVGLSPVIPQIAAGSRSELVGQAPEPQLPELAATLPAHTSRPDRFGLRAALSAVADAGLGRRELDHAAVLFGIGTGGAPDTEDYLRELLDEQRDELPPHY